MPIGLIIQAILAGLAAAPQVIEAAAHARALITAMFTAKMITKEMQDALFKRVEADLALFAAGVPVHWTVEPDPETPAKPT